MATRYSIEISKLFYQFNDKKLSPRDCVTLQNLKRNFVHMFPDYACQFYQRKPDYTLKSVLLDYYTYQLKCVRKYRYWQYLMDNSDKLQIFLDSLSDKDKLLWQEYVIVASRLEYDYPFLYKELLKIVNADRQRRLRLKKRIQRILEKGNAYFVTLTFTDECLANTQPHIRRKYVCELIKSISDDFVGNIDFGKKRGREHYHVVLHTDKFKDLEYKYYRGVGYSANYSVVLNSWSNKGLYFIKQCGNDDSDSDALAKYTCKLTNHAVKETTKRNALIYSR